MDHDDEFTALVLDEDGGEVTASIRSLGADKLPEGEVTVAVAYSDLNYKDAMIVKGQGGLVRDYPHVPGIDLAGVVTASRSAAFKPGDRVVLTGWRVGERHWGGYATRARVAADWLVPLPDGMTVKEAAAIGTAGFTAMLAVMALEAHGLEPGGERDVLVTGAAGGVGSIAVALLAGLGYRVAASTGRPACRDYLQDLGATEVLERAELAEPANRPLESERWAGCIDSVGGTTLARVLTQVAYHGSVAAVGLAGGYHLETTVIPFLLRGVNLLGIESAMCPAERRLAAWRRLAKELARDKLERITTVVPLAQVPDLAGRILLGEVRGRTVIEVGA